MDYDATPACLEAPLDPMDADAYIHLPHAPAFGYRLVEGYIAEHAVA